MENKIRTKSNKNIKLSKSLKDEVLIIIPIYNEEKKIENLINKVIDNGYKNLLVINDASTDNTYKILKGLQTNFKKGNLMILNHPINRGAGAATFTGLIYARRNNYKYAVLIDGDGQHNPDEIDKLIINLLKGYDVVIGSRFIKDYHNTPIRRILYNLIGSLVTFIIFGKFVLDTQSGFKALNRKAINKINITFDRFEFSSEMIGEIKKHNLKVKEVPIKVNYSKYSLNKAHGQSLKNGIKMVFRFLLK